MPSRAFVGIALAPEVCEALEAARAAFVDAAPEWSDEKWVPAANLHVTLKFIGPLADEALPAAREALTLACANVPRFTIEPVTVTAVPGPRHARMLWVSSRRGAEEAGVLAAAVGKALLPFGVPAEERPFRTHVTLARTRKPRKAPAAAMEAAARAIAAGPGAMSVAAVTLYSSRLGRVCPTYEVISQHPLKAD